MCELFSPRQLLRPHPALDVTVIIARMDTQRKSRGGLVLLTSSALCLRKVTHLESRGGGGFYWQQTGQNATRQSLGTTSVLLPQIMRTNMQLRNIRLFTCFACAGLFEIIACLSSSSSQ